MYSWSWQLVVLMTCMFRYYIENKEIQWNVFQLFFNIYAFLCGVNIRWVEVWFTKIAPPAIITTMRVVNPPGRNLVHCTYFKMRYRYTRGMLHLFPLVSTFESAISLCKNLAVIEYSTKIAIGLTTVLGTLRRGGFHRNVHFFFWEASNNINSHLSARMASAQNGVDCLSVVCAYNNCYNFLAIIIYLRSSYQQHATSSPMQSVPNTDPWWFSLIKKYMISHERKISWHGVISHSTKCHFSKYDN